MAWKTTLAILFALSDTADAQACRIDGFSLTMENHLVGARGGYYAVVKPEEVKTKAMDVSALLSEAGVTSVDGFSIDKTGQTQYVASGSDFYEFSDGKFVKKHPFPKEMLDEGFDKVDGFAIIDQMGHVAFAKGQEFMILKIEGEGKVTIIPDEKSGSNKHPFPALLADNGFTSLDSFTVDMGGTFVGTKGSHYIVLKDDKLVDGGKKCLPSVMTSNGFNSIDGMSVAPDGQVWAFKDKMVMSVMPGAVITKKTAFPTHLTKHGFDTIDAFSIVADEVWFAKGGQFVGFKGESTDPIGGKVHEFPKALTDAGFDSIQGLTIMGAEGYCVAKDGNYMCMSADSTKVIAPKAPFPAGLADYKKIDGLLRRGDVTAITADGYLTAVKDDGTVVIAKQALPSTLTDELCGPAACIGGIALGAAEAPKKSDNDVIADGVVDAKPLPAAKEVGATKSAGDAVPAGSSASPSPSPKGATASSAPKSATMSGLSAALLSMAALVAIAL